MIGKIRTLNKEKGFGFIKAEDGNDYFFHRTGVDKSNGMTFEQLVEKTNVQFEATEGIKGKRAENVEVV